MHQKLMFLTSRNTTWQLLLDWTKSFTMQKDSLTIKLIILICSLWMGVYQVIWLSGECYASLPTKTRNLCKQNKFPKHGDFLKTCRCMWSYILLLSLSSLCGYFGTGIVISLVRISSFFPNSVTFKYCLVCCSQDGISKAKSLIHRKKPGEENRWQDLFYNSKTIEVQNFKLFW